MSEDPQRKSRSTESFYGRRKGNALRGRKQKLMDELLPKLIIDPMSSRIDDLATLFPRPVNALHLEIGFGGGEHLTNQADLNRDVGFIGVEPFINGMAKMLGTIEDHQLENVRLYDDDASQLLDWLPDNCLDRIDLLYPDPWPKKRHWKRRFISQNNLDRFVRVLKPGGRFRFASDIDTYINWTLQHIDAQRQLNWLAQTASDWQSPWDGWTRTRYEAKAIREGRPPAYLQFTRED